MTLRAGAPIPRPRWNACALALSLLPLAACRADGDEPADGSREIAIARMLPSRAWELWDEGRLLGVLVRCEDPADPRRALFSVRNRDRQEMGLVDLEGRAWRHRPHEREPEWLGTGTVLDGARRILGGTPGTRTTEIGLERLQDR